MTSLDPQTSSDRIVELDALRGLAVIGIVLMNVFAFAMPPAAYFNPAAWGGTLPPDLVSWAASFVLVEDKFRNLFAMMFGAGVAILLDKGGAQRLRGHYARMAVLFAIGFLHALLLSSGDVLRLYAVAGLLLPLVVNWPVRRLLITAGALIAIHMAVAGYVAWGWTSYWWQFHTVPGTDPAPLAPAQAAFGADPQALQSGLAQGREALGERIERRFAAPVTSLLAGLVFLPTALAAMLVGIALLRSGLLRAEWDARRLVRLGILLAAISIPPLVALAWLAFEADFHGAVIGTNALVWSVPFDLLLAIGWAAFVMVLFQRARERGWVGRLAATGRMALTNYLGTSLVLGAIFYSWGLGLFGEVDRIGTYAIALVPILLMLFISPLWLARFRQGPAEWTWRSLAQMRALPLR